MKDVSGWPLLVLMDQVKEWADSARSEALGQTRAEHAMWAERLRGSAKEVVVWLELHGQEAAAGELDAAMVQFREAVWVFGRACVGAYPPDDAQCREWRERMIGSADHVSGVCEDLHGTVPRGTWEGFPDD